MASRKCSPLFAPVVVKLSSATNANIVHQGYSYTRIRKIIRHPFMLCWGAPREKHGKGVGQTIGRFYAGCCMRISENPSTKLSEK
jgi:hypothetical protein